MEVKKYTEYKKKNILFKLFLFICILVLLILFIPKQERTIGQLEGPDCGITLSLKSIKPSGLTLIWTQSGGELSGSLMTNFDFYVQVLENGEWVSVPYIKTAVYVGGAAYFITMGEHKEIQINWERTYGKLKRGTYRILYEFQDYRAPGDYDTATYFAEFKIR